MNNNEKPIDLTGVLTTPTKQERIEAYAERQKAKVERLEERAAKARNDSNASFKRSHELTEHIPFGQPILVGHHSERRHRNTLDKAWNLMGKAVAQDKKADYLERRAGSAASDTSIRSDNPEALELLREKLAKLQAGHKAMVDANKVIRKSPKNELTEEKRVALIALGIPEKEHAELFAPRYGRPGFASFSLSNSTGNIGNVKKRIAELEAREGFETCNEFINGIEIVQNVEENRVQIFFQGKPDDDTRTDMKRHGFKWSRRNGCWQTWLKHWNVREARRIAETI